MTFFFKFWKHLNFLVWSFPQWNWEMAWHSSKETFCVWSEQVFVIYLKIQFFLSLLILLPQIKYPGADMDITLSAPSFCRQISPEEFEYQRAYGSQEPLADLLEEVITDAKLSSKEKKKKLKQVKRIFFISHIFFLLFLCVFKFSNVMGFMRISSSETAVLKIYCLVHVF